MSPLTPYADVNALLSQLQTDVQAILRAEFVGMYLYGSLAMGAFNPASSDIDFVVVTEHPVSGEALAALQAMHQRIGARPGRWSLELEGSYIPRAALRRHDPANARFPHIDRGSPALAVEQHDMDWIIQRYVLREHGIALVGPPLPTLIDPVTPAELRQAVTDLYDFWWRPMIVDASHLQSVGYRAYAILTMPRLLVTLEEGIVVTKPDAAQWALATLPPRWTALVRQALAWAADQDAGQRFDAGQQLRETQAFIAFVGARIQALDAGA